VIAGQQPGLFLGPHLTFYKIATARALALSLAERFPGPFVPLFWIASHDADRAEVDSVVLPGDRGEPGARRFPFGPAGPRTQVGALSVEPGPWNRFLDDLREALPETAFRDPVLDSFRGLVEKETPLTLLFARTANLLAAEAGVLFFDGRDAEIDPRGRAILARAVREGPAVLAALQEGEGLLEKAGFRPPLVSSENRLPLFLLEGHDRIPLALEGRAVRPEGSALVPAEELADRIAAGEARATPAAALRPVVQDALFPNAATVAGHSELLYHAGLGPLYALLGVPRPALVPRASFALLTRGTAERLRKIGVRPEDLAPGEEPASPPIPWEESVRALAENVRIESERAFSEFDRAAPGAVGPEDPLRRRLVREAERTAERLLELGDRATENRRGRIHRARQELFPGGRTQETTLSLLYSLVRHGAGVLDAVAEAIEPGEGTPRLLVLERTET
jgi:uncharacterized protein YllA (UPF0747 family)